jgi:hypothetical protein
MNDSVHANGALTRSENEAISRLPEDELVSNACAEIDAPRRSIAETVNQFVQTVQRQSWSLLHSLQRSSRINDHRRGTMVADDIEFNNSNRYSSNHSDDDIDVDSERRQGQKMDVIPWRLISSLRNDRRKTLTAMIALISFPITMRTTVDVSGQRILDYVVCTGCGVWSLLSMSAYDWVNEVYPAMRMLAFALALVLLMLIENVCVALISNLDKNKYSYEGLQDNLRAWLEEGCASSDAFSSLFCGRFPGWNTLHFGAWIILGVLGPVYGKDKKMTTTTNTTSIKKEGERSVFGIAGRTCATIALARAIRVLAFMSTVLPNPLPDCYRNRFKNDGAPDVYEDGLHLIEFGLSRIRGGGGCNDLIFSGHGVIYMSAFLCIATHGVSIGSLIVFFAVFHRSCMEILDQTHYGVDMWLSIAVTALSWRECVTVERWVTGKQNTTNNREEAEEGVTINNITNKKYEDGEIETLEEQEEKKSRFCLSAKAKRVVGWCLPFFIFALVVAGASVFISIGA